MDRTRTRALSTAPGTRPQEGNRSRRALRAARLQGAFGGTLVALAGAAGLMVGLRSVVALGAEGLTPLLRLPPFPHEGFGVVWTPGVIWPADLQRVALIRLGGVIVGLFLAAASVGALNAVVLLAEAGGSRRREVAVRAAVGAPPRTLVRLLLADVQGLLSVAVGLGLVLGVTAGGALRGLWPGALAALGPLNAAGTVAGELLALAGLVGVAYVWTGLTLGRSASLSGELGAGERATDDAPAIFRRRALSAVQMGAAGSVTLASVALALAVRGPTSQASPSEGTTVLAVSAPPAAHWQELLAGLATIPGVAAESLATPGTLVDLGVRDYALAQCGRCIRGGFPAPLWGVDADHYAVGPGYFSLAGRRVVSGRGFAASDGPGAAKVALVNETFARTAFEKGDPIGHKLHLGRDPDAWYDVVGVVADAAPPVVGRDDVAHSEVWVSALQQPPRRAQVLLRADDSGVRSAVALLSAKGYDPGMPLGVGAVLGRAAAPLAWVGHVALALALLTLVLALQGAHATALQVSRRRLRELAVRRALGASNRRAMLFILAGSARGALWASAVAAFFGALFVALLRKVAAGVPLPGPTIYLGMSALLVAAAVLASLQAGREAMRVEPGEVVA